MFRTSRTPSDHRSDRDACNPDTDRRRDAAARYGRDAYAARSGKRKNRARRSSAYTPMRTRRKHGAKGFAAFAAALAALIVAAPFFMEFAADPFGRLPSPGGDAPQVQDNRQESGESTPRSQWRKGTVPLLLQTDPAWADGSYAGGTIGENGCGPTCLTMAYICQTGRTDMDPAAMCAFSETNGYVESGMTAWRLISEGSFQLGLTCDELPASADAIAAAIAQGRTVICSVGPGDFTTVGHFIVVRAVDDMGRFLVADPNSERRSNPTWEPDRLLPQCRNIWAIGA